MSDTYKMTLNLATTANAEPDAKAILDKAQQQVGFIPNMYAAMANLPALLQAYTAGYDLFRKAAGFSAVEQEVVFITISRENGCHYCVAAHSVVADMFSKVPQAVTEAVRKGQQLPDLKLNALRDFARTMVVKRGHPETADVRRFLDAGYTEKHILGIILAIGVKTLSNYSNHVFHTPIDSAFQSRVWMPSAA